MLLPTSDGLDGSALVVVAASGMNQLIEDISPSLYRSAFPVKLIHL